MDRPEQRLRSSSSAVQSFLDGRNAAEVSIIADAISLLEEHARGERDGIDTAMEEFIHLKDGWKTAALAATPASGGKSSIGLPNRPPISRGWGPTTRSPSASKRSNSKSKRRKTSGGGSSPN